jgi:CBS domain-containing protein
MGSHPQFSLLKSTLDDLGAASDTARLQLHLLAMEARQRSSELGAGIDNLEQRLDRGLHQALSTAAEKARQLSKTVHDSLSAAPSRASAGPDRVGNIMTGGVLVCSADDSLARAAQIMWDGDCGIVPVVDANYRLEGVITDRDLCMAAYTKGRALHEISVADVMSRAVHRCSADDSLARAIAIMAETRVRRLPVVNAEQQLVGILSVADIVRGVHVLEQREAEQLIFQLLASLTQRRPPAPAAE